MVKKILSFVGKEISGLHEAAYLLAGSAVASLIFALVRDRLLAHFLGASSSLDVYYAAFRVPDFLFVTVASLVSAAILVPFLIDNREKEASGEVPAGDLRESISSLFSAFSIIILATCAVAFLIMPFLDGLLFSNLVALGHGPLLVSMSRILLLSPILLGLASFFASLAQIRNRFIIYAFSSALYNVGIIFGILFFLPTIGVAGLAWGVALGAAMFAAAQIPVVVRDGLFPRFVADFASRGNWKKIRRIIVLSIPRTITMSSQQITELGLISFASFLSAGSISIFNLAFNLQSVPLSIVGGSYSSAAFPVLAKLVAQKKREEFLGKMIDASKHVIFWSAPIMALFIVLRAQIVRVILGSGQFTWSDTRLTAAALALFVVSSFGQSLMLIFVRAFYAEGKTSKPLLINVVSTIVTVILGFLLVKLFHSAPAFSSFVVSLMKTDGASDSSVLMLPLAFTLGALLNMYLHWRAFSKEFPAFNKPVLATAWHSFAAAVVGGYAAYIGLVFFGPIFGLTTTFGVFMQGFLGGVIGIIVIYLTLKLLRSPELHEIHEAVRHKVWKVDKASLDKLPS
ncbi:MAG: hypothetical protein KGI79_00545 [Patescibacteria group bacterium]|nr:hypothetical protein [Patescibacteria group bacterium]MDE2116351.1 hypothetical protein [Patescibacteria group bacterium]